MRVIGHCLSASIWFCNWVDAQTLTQSWNRPYRGSILVLTAEWSVSCLYQWSDQLRIRATLAIASIHSQNHKFKLTLWNCMHMLLAERSGLVFGLISHLVSFMFVLIDKIVEHQDSLMVRSHSFLIHQRVCGCVPTASSQTDYVKVVIVIDTLQSNWYLTK